MGRPTGYYIYSQTELLGMLHAWVKKYGKVPRLVDWEEATDEHPSGNTIKQRFVTWNAFLLTAGYSVEPAEGGRNRVTRPNSSRQQRLTKKLQREEGCRST